MRSRCAHSTLENIDFHYLVFWQHLYYCNPCGFIIYMFDIWYKSLSLASQVVLVVKNLPVNAGDLRDLSLIPESGRCPGGGYGNPLQYSCLENPMDRGTWRATVRRVAKSHTPLKQLSTHTHSLFIIFPIILSLVNISYSSR